MTRLYDQADYIGGMSGGQYVYNYKACIPGSLSENCEALTIPHTLVDPCNPPDSVDLADLVDQSYTITQGMQSYTHPQPTISPLFCEVSTTYSMPSHTLTTNPISEPTAGSRRFDIFYDADLRPITESQTPLNTVVNVRGHSKYTYGGALDFEKTVSKDFDLTILNPCIDTAYFEILPRALPP